MPSAGAAQSLNHWTTREVPVVPYHRILTTQALTLFLTTSLRLLLTQALALSVTQTLTLSLN